VARMTHADPNAKPQLAATYAHIERTRGTVSNVLKSFSHAPEGLERFAALGEYVRYRNALPPRARELAILTIARGIQYAWTHHVTPALKAGVTQAELDAYNTGNVAPTLSSAERAAIAFAREFANGGQVTNASFEEARKHYSERQVTDLMLLCGYFIALGFSVNAFQVDLESDRTPLMKPVGGA
jgi:4-carboxymuconolactone decarboxylase